MTRAAPMRAAPMRTAPAAVLDTMADHPSARMPRAACPGTGSGAEFYHPSPNRRERRTL